MNELTADGPSVLAALRALVPRRPLSYREAERIAELQANRCRELLGIDEPLLDEMAIGSLPHIDVRRRHGIPVSGLTQWQDGRWLIVLNADECEERQRFSLGHEFKHILDHTTQQWVHPNVAPGTLDGRVERLADYFAACLLMPKRHVKSLFYGGTRSDDMAQAFGVSRRAISVRLSQLGVVDQRPRCVRRPQPEDVESTYLRPQRANERVAA